MILTLPLLQVLKKKYPDAGIDFLCIPQTSDLLKHNPYVGETIIYDKRKSGNKEFFRIIKNLKKKKYDLIISPHRSVRSALISKFSLPQKSISFDTAGMSFMYDEKVEYIGKLHEIQRNLKLLEPLGIKEDKIIKPEIFSDTEEKNKVDEYLISNGITPRKKFICIAPGSVWFTKRFPEDKFVKVCDLLKSIDVKIVLTGGEQDREFTESILNKSVNENIINSAGKFSITGSAEIIKQAALLLTNDSAPLHIANAVDTDVIAIFGATVPSFGFYPYGENDVIIETNGLKCRPCSIHGGNKCPINTFVCMMNINEERIVDSVISFLK